MSRYDFRTPRLFVEAALRQGASVALDKGQANYLVNVLRLAPGDPVLVFNGRDGEWRAALQREGKKSVSLSIGEQTRPQDRACDLHYLFAPLKHARLDYMVQKAVELGVSRLQPVTTRHTQAARVNLERMRANAIEAAEQCGILTIAEVAEALPLAKALDALSTGSRSDLLRRGCARRAIRSPRCREIARGTPLAVLIGPEGGFAEDERALLLRQPNVVRLALGPRILRADTAAVAALTLVQAVLGDWG